MNLGIAEEFLSVQGEGLYVGTSMYFIRLAGCSVGKPIDNAGVRPSYIEQCTTYDGRKFLCDTDFRVVSRPSTDEIIARIPHVKHICITGGEPLNQQLAVKDLVDKVRTQFAIHIETSGTVAPDWLLNSEYRKIWVAVSPKQGVLLRMLQRANEIKLLVDEDFDEKKTEELLKGLTFYADDQIIWVQPVNDEHTVDNNNATRCLELVEQHPTWRLSLQLHKVLGVR